MTKQWDRQYSSSICIANNFGFFSIMLLVAWTALQILTRSSYNISVTMQISKHFHASINKYYHNFMKLLPENICIFQNASISRLSLIPEQQSTLDEGGDTSDTTQSQTSPLGDYASPPNKWVVGQCARLRTDSFIFIFLASKTEGTLDLRNRAKPSSSVKAKCAEDNRLP